MDLYHSDYFPIVLTLVEGVPATSKPRYIFQKADMPLFKQLAICNSAIDSFGGVEEAIEYFGKVIDKSAKVANPRTKGLMKTRQVPWWNNELRQAIEERKRACIAYYRSRLVVDKIAFQRAGARVRYLMKTSRVNSWKQYTEGLNQRTSMNKVWKKVK